MPMGRIRRSSIGSRRIERIGLGLLVGLVMLAVPAIGAGAPPSASAGPSLPPATAHPAVTQIVPSSTTAFVSSSVGARSLVAFQLTNGSWELLLFDAATNATSVVVVASPAATISPGFLTAAGGHFFVAVWNLTSLRDLFVQVNTSGSYAVVTLPIGPAWDWQLPYGNATALFAAAKGLLVEINPTTRTLLANYSSSIPAGLTVEDLLPSGGYLYLAGFLANATGATSAYFGRLALATGTTTHIATAHYVAGPYSNGFFALGLRGTDLWVGGGQSELAVSAPTFTQATISGSLWVYNTTTGTFTDRTGWLAASPHAEVFGIAPWTGGLILSVERYDFTATSSSTYGWLYTPGSGGLHLVNRTAYLPAGYVADYFDVTSQTGGYLFSAGMSSTGLAEIVALKV